MWFIGIAPMYNKKAGVKKIISKLRATTLQTTFLPRVYCVLHFARTSSLFLSTWILRVYNYFQTWIPIE